MSPCVWHPDFAAWPLCRSVAHLAPLFAGHLDWPDAAALTHLAKARQLRNADGRAVRFTPQLAPCGQRQYEMQILATGEVPTRPASGHDFFNALAWLAFPQSKATLNAVHCREFAASQGTGRRSPGSDAATLFDESGLVLVAPNGELAALLRAKQWKRAFWEQRALWAGARLYVIGHALMERAAAPYPGLTGKCLCLETDRALPADDAPPRWLDAAIAVAWQEGRIERPADLITIPVLGVPGMDPANADAAYYDNTAVFRPPRH